MMHYDVRTVGEAISLLSRHKGGARIIAGGVDVVSLLKSKVANPEALINIKTIPNLSYIEEASEGIRIGTLTTLSEIERSTVIRDNYSLLSRAAHSVAAPQLRNMATIGGNLCQEVQCWYYRRSPLMGISFNCFRKGGKRCYAITGENAEHAIFNGHKCYAVCPSDIASALVALGATMKIAGPNGERTLPLDDFYAPLGNALKSDELLTEIEIPAQKPGTTQHYRKFSLRKTIDFSIVNVAAAIAIESGLVSNARIVLGGVAPAPYRVLSAEESLRGKEITESLAETLARAGVSKSFPLSRNGYKVPIAIALIRRAIIMEERLLESAFRS
jgi:xanthine dehydrogenase YagS FAD-binding subunit